MSGSIDPQVTQVPLTEDQRSQIHVNRVRALLIRHSQASGQGFPQSLIENNPPPSTTPPRPPTPEPITNTSSTDAVDPPTEEQTGNEQTNAPSAKKSRQKPKCSLCKSEGHTRNYHKDEEQYAEFFKTLEEKKRMPHPNRNQKTTTKGATKNPTSLSSEKDGKYLMERSVSCLTLNVLDYIMEVGIAFLKFVCSCSRMTNVLMCVN